MLFPECDQIFLCTNMYLPHTDHTGTQEREMFMVEPQYSPSFDITAGFLDLRARFWARSRECSSGREAQLQRVTSGFPSASVGNENSRCCRWYQITGLSKLGSHLGLSPSSSHRIDIFASSWIEYSCSEGEQKHRNPRRFPHWRLDFLLL